MTFFNKVVAFAKKHNITVVHDAAYSEFYFAGDKPISFLEAERAKEIGDEINSLSKSISLAGARIAYITGNRDVILIMRSVKANLDDGVIAAIQESTVMAINHAEEITDQLRITFKEQHHVLMEGLKQIGWKVAPSNGGMFIWAKYPSDKDDVQFVYEVIEKTGVVMVPGSVFGTEGKGYVRIALVHDTEKLERAVKKLQEI